MHKITIKNVQYAEFQSHETHCFHATVYKDGKRWCFAENDGHGGPTMLYALNDGNPAQLREDIKAFGLGPEGVESLVEQQVTEWLYTRDLKKLLKKVAAVRPDGAVVQFDMKPSDFVMDRLKKSKPDYTFLNTLPFDQALTAFRGACEA